MSALTDRLLELVPDLRLHREVDDDREVMIYGSPGTGKSTSLIKILDAHIQAGLPMDQMLVNAFTRNATAELRRRLSSQYGITDIEMSWVRTIHSSCFNLLQLRPEQTVSMHLLKEFGEASGYRFQGVLSQRNIDDPYAVGSIQTFGDWCYTAEELRRALLLTPAQIVTKLRHANPTDTAWGEKEAAHFSQSYAGWKKDGGMVDFADMLELVLAHRLRPPVRWIFLDECQDLTPAQWSVVSMWKEGAERLLAWGDVDQSIFSWAGSLPSEVWNRPGHQLFLSHSYRLSSVVHAEAQRIIRRIPAAERAPEGWTPHYTGGVVDRLFGWADRPEGGEDLAQRITASGDASWLMLVRNRAFAEPIRNVLTDAAIPFRDRTSMAGIPKADSPRGQAIKVAADLHAGRVVRGGTLRLLMRQVYAGQWDNDKTSWGRSYSLVDLIEAGAQPRLVQEIATDPLGAIRMEPHERAYLKRVARRSGLDALLAVPCVEVSTIHGAKGEEADHVAVSTSMTRRTYQGYQENHDDEDRVFYVAATRAKKTLTWIVDGQGFRL